MNCSSLAPFASFALLAVKILRHELVFETAEIAP